MKWISVEERLPDSFVQPIAVMLDGRPRRCCGFSAAFPGGDDGTGDVVPPQPAEWWLDCEGINTVESGVTHWMPLPPPPGDEQ